MYFTGSVEQCMMGICGPSTHVKIDNGADHCLHL